MIKLKDLLEVKFRKSNKYIHLADLPMFSIYIDKELSQDKLEEFKKTDYVDECAKARNTIHKIGFPSMHANIVITDLSKDANRITGGGVAGRASTWIRYMQIDPLHVSDSTIVHEWAHLWMDNNGKEFIKAVGTFYSYLQKKAAADMTPALEKSKKFTNEEENRILDNWAKVFHGLVSYGTRDAAQSMYIIKIRKSITPDMFKFLPHLLKVTGILKQNIVGENLSGYRREIQAGEEVNAEKVNDGWIIGQYSNQQRCETVITGLDKIFQYVDSKIPGSNILTDIQLEVKKSFARHTTRLGHINLESEILKKIKYELTETFKRTCESFQTKPTSEDIALVESWAQQYVYPVYIQILRNKKLLLKFNDKPKESYEFLWVSNKLKPDTVSFMKLVKEIASRDEAKKSKLNLVNMSSFDSPEFEYYRDVMKHLNKWATSYGMANSSELWATAIEWFFLLPQNHRKTIIKLMMRMGAT